MSISDAQVLYSESHRRRLVRTRSAGPQLLPDLAQLLVRIGRQVVARKGGSGVQLSQRPALVGQRGADLRDPAGKFMRRLIRVSWTAMLASPGFEGLEAIADQLDRGVASGKPRRKRIGI